jgi:hypothetical protein
VVVAELFWREWKKIVGVVRSKKKKEEEKDEVVYISGWKSKELHDC